MEGSKNTEEDSLMNAIKFYQDGLHRYMDRNDEFKMLHSLNKLSRYPIKVCHLKETGVGRTVNLLVKLEGKVGEEANKLINKWKQMVEKEKEVEESSDDASPQVQRYQENSTEHYSKFKQTLSERNSESDEELNKKSQAEKENRGTERHRSSKHHESNKSHDHKKHESSDRNKHKSSHDRKESKHSDKNEKEKHSSRHERSSKEKDRENDKRKEKERDSQRDKSHRDNGEKSKKEKDERKEKEHKGYKEKESSSRKEKDDRHRKDNDRSERKEREEKTHKEKDDKRKEEKSQREKDRKNEDDKKEKDKKTTNTSSSKKDKTSSSKSYSTEISSGSGTSFADALGMMEIPMKPKKSDKKESTSSSKHHKSNTSSETPPKDKKSDKKESSSSSRHRKVEKSPESGGSPVEVKKEKKSDKKDRHHKTEVSSQSGTSFEDALGMMEMPRKEKKSAKRDRSVLYEGEICSNSSTSFEAALGMMEMPKKKKKLMERQVERSPSPIEEEPIVPLPSTPLDKNELISSLLPSITPNYRPIRVTDSKHPCNEFETLNSFMTNKHQRTKIYSGNKSSFTKVPSLFDICVQLLQVHIDAIEGTGGVPYSILKPVLEKATPTQLLRLEFYNSYLTEDSDELWQLHCLKDFRNQKREECETWREMYTRCTEEREARLLTLTAKVKMSKEKSTPVMQTKIAYIDPPNRGLNRRSVKHLPSAPMAKAKVELMVKESKSSSDVVVTHNVRAARGSSSSSAASSGGASSSHAKQIKKVAPLMAKSLSAFKNRFKR